MALHRRDLLKAGLALPVCLSLPGIARSEILFAPKPEGWRSYEVRTRLQLSDATGPAKAWVPIPAMDEPAWFRAVETSWTVRGGSASLARDPKYGAEMVVAEWHGRDPAVLELTSRFSTRDRAVDLSSPGPVPPLSPDQVRRYTEATELIPTDGIVKTTADQITKGARTDLDKARRIYDWIVDNTFREAKVRGCGIGDIASMLHMGNLGGKCADLNALYVGLARASGLPARDVYGIRVGPSKFGFKSLGANSEVITKAQHCRAEVFLSGFGWVPVDPADVRKVVLEEPPGNLAIGDPKVVAARRALFGSWEMNWLPYNTAHDIALPGSDGPVLGFLMYPQAETSAGRLDCLDPDKFKYEIRAKEIAL